MRPRRNATGFALIELMVIVAILSLAASLFVPRFLKHRIRKQQEECTRNLRALYDAEKIYQGRQGSYTSDLSELGWAPQGRRYQYRFLEFGKTAYRFVCSGNIDKDPTLDSASIDQNGRIERIEDDVTH